MLNINRKFACAMNKEGIVIDADELNESNKTDEYSCVHCRVKMGARYVSATGTYYFATYPNLIHTNDRCIKICENGKQCSLKQNGTPEEFIQSLMHVSSAKRSNTTVNSQRINTAVWVEDEEDDEMKILGFTSLKQLYEEGLDNLKPNQPIGFNVLSDYILHYKWAKHIINSNSEIGPRVVYARYAWNNKREGNRFLDF